jgi:hypothetical protein
MSHIDYYLLVCLLLISVGCLSSGWGHVNFNFIMISLTGQVAESISLSALNLRIFFFLFSSCIVPFLDPGLSARQVLFAPGPSSLFP